MAREITKVYLNTWGAYNDGCIGYGWMTPEEARDFIDEDDERDGGEWFIADIDNYLGVKFGSLEYANVDEILETIETLEALEDWELDEVVALMDYLSTNDAQEAIDSRDSYTFFSDIEAYHDCCDELIEMELNSDSIISRYFDYDAYYRDCDFDIYEASNGVCILG
jgi:antirestriction protein